MGTQAQKIGAYSYRIFFSKIEWTQAVELGQAFIGLEGQKRTLNLARDIEHLARLSLDYVDFCT